MFAAATAMPCARGSLTPAMPTLGEKPCRLARIPLVNYASIFSSHETPHSLHPRSDRSGRHLSRHSGTFTYVSWFDAARFTNWLHNGQKSGLQNASTTEDGAYTLDGATSGVAISKNVGATVWIPSTNEWYKAAYYDPNKGGAGVGGYWVQATQSNTVAGNSIGVANSANYYYDGNYVGYPGAALTDVGAYGVDSDSAYGTNDQAGNVLEWYDGLAGPKRGLRGGSWDTGSYSLTSSYAIAYLPQSEDRAVGFRVVASVPEPSTVLSTLLSVSACLTRRRRSTL